MICAFIHSFGKRLLWQGPASGALALRRAAPALLEETPTLANPGVFRKPRNEFARREFSGVFFRRAFKRGRVAAGIWPNRPLRETAGKCGKKKRNLPAGQQAQAME